MINKANLKHTTHASKERKYIMNDLLEEIEAYYEDYVEYLTENNPQQTPLSKEDYVKQICFQLQQSVYDEMKWLLES